ncbi:MAG TPA: histidinol dehydrogenase [Bacteroidetes bacterium]|nr:histidinol dehydrogenase [Bacteroidota bacterium]
MVQVPLMQEDEFRARLRRSHRVDFELREQVADILRQVQEEGDAALLRLTRQLDGVERASPALTPEERASGGGVGASVLDLLRRAAENVRAFHRAELESLQPWRKEEDGAWLAQQFSPLRRVGVYVPGGSAAYPSSVLMNVIPAQVAGVEEIALVSPPTGPGGRPHPLVLAAAEVLGVREIYAAGGAQAVAALAFGTETVPAVDFIAGPGNRYVNEAKRQVFGLVGVDSLAGPSEILILADGEANPAFVAADLLSQAEHDPDARAVCLSPSDELLRRVQQELARQLAALPRKEIAAESLRRNGALVAVPDMRAALELANEIAPEHLELMVSEPEPLLPQIRCAGAVFVGSATPEPVGDYWAGSNHVLPTGGSARFASGLSVRDFLRWTNVVSYSPGRLARDAEAIAQFARLEGLEAHARAVEIRLAGEEEGE